MKVLLIKPYGLSDHIQPPLGLAYLAAVSRPRHSIAILDCIKERLRVEDLRNHLTLCRYDVIGIQCYTMDLPVVKELLTWIKTQVPPTITIIGGPHPSSDPVGAMTDFAGLADYAFQGEAEIGFPLLLDSLEQGGHEFSTIPGLVWRVNKAVMLNPPVFHEPLDDFGMPAWDLLHPETYPPAQHGAFYQQFPIAPITTSRGCPFNCIFCAGRNISGRKHRRRSVESVLAEIRYLYEHHGIREFHFIDDNFSFHRGHAKKLLRELLKANLDISWATPNGVRMETLDDELLTLMKATGLYLVSLGIESGSNRVLTKIRKHFNLDTIYTKVEMIARHQIPIAGFFVIGFPSETPSEIEQTIRLAVRLPLIRANFFTFLPFPGTEAYAQLLESGELKGVDWERFYFMNAAYTPVGLSRSALKHLQRKAFMKFFLRPRVLWYNLQAIRSRRHFYYLVKRFYHWIIMQK